METASSNANATRIVCAVDLGPQTEETLRQAVQQAAARHAELVVYHAVRVAPSAVPADLMAESPGDMNGLAAAARRKIEELIGRLTGATSTMPAVRVESEVTFDATYAAVVKETEKRGAALLIVGAQGTSAFEHLFLGSVADKVIRYAHCPVLVVRPGTTSGRVIVATDFSEAAQLALQLGADEARRRDVGLTVVHCLDLSASAVIDFGLAAGVPATREFPQLRATLHKEAEARLHDLLERARTRADIIIEDGPAIAAITRLSEELHPSLIVVGSTGKTGLDRVLLGSVAESVVRKAACSVLAVRAGEQLPPMFDDRANTTMEAETAAREVNEETRTAGPDQDGRIPPGASGEDF